MEDIKIPKTRWVLYAWILSVLLTAIALSSMTWMLIQTRKYTLEAARIQARVAYDKDVIYRRWNAEKGGVYVPVTEDTPPNPHLSDFPERDIETASGVKLTLMNHAYMTRQVHEMEEKALGIRGHLTSLKPIRPENAPDSWETEALHAFENGETEVSEMTELNNMKYMRLMKPLITEESCLKCHASQGYKRGDIYGGISIAIPMKPLLVNSRLQSYGIIGGHVVILLLVIWLIRFWTKKLAVIEKKRKIGEVQLQQEVHEKEILLKEIHHRVKNNLQLVHSLLGLNSPKIQDKVAAETLEGVRNRVISMAKIHEELYQSKNLSTVNFARYIGNLSEYLNKAYSGSAGVIGISIQVGDVSAGVDRAIPCGLVITELVSNAFKHAFGPGFAGKGRIEISLQLVDKDTALLIVEDNGIGLPEDVDIHSVESLGLQLVKMMVETQLDGELVVERLSKGTRFSVRFKLFPS